MIGELSFTSTMFIVTCTVLCKAGEPPKKIVTNIMKVSELVITEAYRNYHIPKI